jgi:tetratricopeptide (TPR) repeat protein
MMNLSRFFNTALLLALVAVAGGGCTKAAREKRAVNRADQLFKAGDYTNAEVAYSNACFMVFPRDPRALRGWGLVYLTEGRQAMAMGLLRMAAESLPNDAQLQSEYAGLCAEVGLTAKAKDAARLALKTDPGNEKALLALCDAIRGPDDALQTRHYIEQLQKQDQDRATYHLALSIIDARDANTLAAAETELNTAKSLDPKSSTVYLALARLSAHYKNLKGADEAFQKAVELAPLRSPARLTYAEFQNQTGATNQARESMVELIRQAPDYLPPYIFLMNLSFAEHKLDDCSSFISQILAREPGNYDALLLKGQVSMEKKDGKQAVEDFERLAALNPRITRPQDQYTFGQAYLLNGDTPKAAAAFNRALELDTNFVPAKLTLAELDMVQGNSVAATALLAPLLKQTNLSQSVTVPASLILAQSYLAQKSPDQAIALYAGLEKAFPRDAQIPWLEGRAWASENKPAQARAAFEKSLAANSDYVPSLAALVDLDLAESHFAPALELVKQRLDRNPASPVLWLLQANIHMRQQEDAQAQADLDKVIALDPKQPDPYILLARLYVKQNQQRQALDKLNSLIALTNNATALMQIAIIHEQLKEYDQASQACEKLLVLETNSLFALNSLAWLYSEHLDQLDKAYALATKERKLYPDVPSAADILGWILYKKGDYPRALALLRESQEKQPADSDYNFHLGMAHYMLGEEEAARLSLKFALSKSDFESTNEALHCLKILDFDPKTATPADRADFEKQPGIESDPVALIRLAALQERDGQFEKAGATYEKLIKLTPENSRALVRLALLDSTRLNQPQKALELAKNAYKLAPDDPAIAAALGRMEFQAGDHKYALGLLQAAARVLPSQPDLLRDLAWASFSVGKVADARSAMLSALQSGLPADKTNDAAQFLEMTAAYGNPPQTPPEARVRQILQADSNYAPALMARGLILAQQGQATEAEQSCEKVLAVFPGFAPAARQLAILYVHDGNNDSKAAGYAKNAADAYPDDPEMAKVAGIVDYRRKEYSKALQSLTQSAHDKQDDAELLLYLGMDYNALKKPADAKKALQQALDLKKLPADLAAQATNVLGQLK